MYVLDVAHAASETDICKRRPSLWGQPCLGYRVADVRTIPTGKEKRGERGVDLQDGKFPWLDRQNREQEEADYEAGCCGEVEASEHQKAIPSIHWP